MPVLETRFNALAPEAKEHRAQLLEHLETVRSLEQKVCDNSARKKSKFEKRGQLLPRERLSGLLDPGRPFLELSTLAGLRMHDDDGKKNVTGGGCITGIGWVSGVRCVISISDSAIQGGSISPMGLKKSLRAQEIALENKLALRVLVS